MNYFSVRLIRTVTSWEKDKMGIFRIYKGEDNKSHIEELTLSHPVLKSPPATFSIFLRNSHPAHSLTGIPLHAGRSPSSFQAN
jgi:hypothetical protein